MNGILEKLKQKNIELQVKVLKVLHDDRGDTNFISIAIVLAIVLSIVAVFIYFRNEILDKVTEEIQKFLENFNPGYKLK